MVCEPFDTANGRGFMCGPRRKQVKPKKCSYCRVRDSSKQCDFPVRRPVLEGGRQRLVAGTCDKHLCEICAVRIGDDLDQCPDHPRGQHKADNFDQPTLELKEPHPMHGERLLFVDTETTGMPDWKRPSEDPCQPHIVEIALKLYEGGGDLKLIQEYQAIVKPDGWTIPADVVEIHGITTERALAEGLALELVLDRYEALRDQATIVIGYNLPFDNKMLRGALARTGRPKRYGDRREMDLIHSTKKACQSLDSMIKTNVKLLEACQMLLGRPHDKRHTAMGDVDVLVDIYRYLREHQYEIKIREPKPDDAPPKPKPAAFTPGTLKDEGMF